MVDFESTSELRVSNFMADISREDKGNLISWHI